MTLQKSISWLALNLLLTFLIANCSNVDVTEIPAISPTPNATPVPIKSYATPLPPTSTPVSVETALLTRYGWTVIQHISSHTVTLPKSFQHHPGDFPYAIYWAYNNEFNKDIGLDLAPYLGQTVQASIYLLYEPLPAEFYPSVRAYAIVIELDNRIIGAWIDQGRHYGFACSLDRKNFNEIVNQEWSEWLISAGVVDLSNELDRELSKKTPEEIIELYYTAMNEGDYQLYNALRSRRALSADLFRNKDNLALFNHQEDEVITRWIDNLESATLLNIREVTSGYSYVATVNFQFIDPHLVTIPEGEHSRSFYLVEEIEGLGWRINR
jgi:hypothetical protein